MVSEWTFVVVAFYNQKLTMLDLLVPTRTMPSMPTTADSTRLPSSCKEHWRTLIKWKLKLISIKVETQSTLPVKVENRCPVVPTLQTNKVHCWGGLRGNFIKEVRVRSLLDPRKEIKKCSINLMISFTKAGDEEMCEPPPFQSFPIFSFPLNHYQGYHLMCRV